MYNYKLLMLQFYPKFGMKRNTNFLLIFEYLYFVRQKEQISTTRQQLKILIIAKLCRKTMKHKANEQQACKTQLNQVT